MQHIKSITLGYYALNGTFVIHKVVGSTEYLPGNSLTKKEVDDLISGRRWKVVTVVHNQQ